MDAYWLEYHRSFDNALKQLSVTTAGGQTANAGRAMQMLCDWTKAVREQDGTIHLIGNGASACMASHFAVDWTKNAGVRALAYNDVAFITAIGNDLGYEKLFSQPMQWYGRKGDLLATISSSGNSPNVLRGIEAALTQTDPVLGFQDQSVGLLLPQHGERLALGVVVGAGQSDQSRTVGSRGWDNLLDQPPP